MTHFRTGKRWWLITDLMDFLGHNYWLHEDQHEHTSLLFTEINSFNQLFIHSKSGNETSIYNMIYSPTLNPDLIFFLTHVNKVTLNKDSRSVNLVPWSKILTVISITFSLYQTRLCTNIFLLLNLNIFPQTVQTLICIKIFLI